MKYTNQSKVLNTRVSTKVYDRFIKKLEDVGISPSVFLKHVIINYTYGDYMFAKSLQNELEVIFDSVRNTIDDEDEALNLVNEERRKYRNEK